MPAREPTVLLTDKCATCIYRPGNLMDLRPGRVAQMTKETRAKDTNVICHKSRDVGGEWTENAYCSGNVEVVGLGQLGRIMERCGFLHEKHPDDMTPYDGDEEE